MFDNNKMEIIDYKGRSFTGVKRVTWFTSGPNSINYITKHGQNNVKNSAGHAEGVVFSDKRVNTMRI